MDRYFEAYKAARLIMGGAVHDEGYALELPQKPPRCTERAIAAREQQLAGGLDDARRLTASAEKPLQAGLWAGLFPICRQTVEGVTIEPGWTGDREIRFRFAKPYDEEYRRYIANFFPKDSVAWPIAVRLDGATIARLTIDEPIWDFGVILPDDVVAKMATAALSACPAG